MGKGDRIQYLSGIGGRQTQSGSLVFADLSYIANLTGLPPKPEF